jgi:ribosome assembly protein YihI (activator of Der GTPase)
MKALTVLRDLSTAMVIPGYTLGMKTAISVPDAIFERVESFVGDAKMSRSEFYATAAARYLDELETHSLTQHLDEALARGGATPAREADAITDAGLDRIAALTADDEW